MAAVPHARDQEKTRRTIGIAIYVIGMLLGGGLLVLMLFVPALFSKHADVELMSLFLGALFAVPMLAIYLWIPWIVDRYDPEPAWALAMTLAWGFIAACGFSALVNTMVDAIGTAMFGKGAGDVLSACISAPVIEEFTKAFAIFFMFYFMRREFDGVVDGVIYATFAALGFAACENILYYGNAAKAEMLAGKEGAFLGTFFVRGILAPWGHPLYTSMTGIGFGVARETNKTWLKWLAPIGGYCFAMFLHSVWNTAATLSGNLVALMLPLWFLFVLAFFGLVIYLVIRKGRIIRDHLKDEVLMGNLTMWEVELITSPVGRWRATFGWGGAAGRKFIDTGARLALSKWHTGRATQGRKLTVSSDMIYPLRQELAKLRAEVSRKLGRPVPQPQPWQPGQPNPWQPQPQPQQWQQQPQQWGPR
ncbi:MAG: PrsW family intramembrane metalloprotease [Labilithrix sp.]|nr:PrsW family intramembrane metalloprotease [Labilithrix sp.]MCW5811883.1 PrsW family intramembrane metalloprotease [Labilithrix sp.]